MRTIIAPHLRSLSNDVTLADLRAQYGDLFDLMRPYTERLMRGPSPPSRVMTVEATAAHGLLEIQGANT